MTFGVHPDGFSPMTEADILKLIEADQLSELSPTLDVSEGSVLGKNNRIFARHLAELWAALDQVYHGNDPDKAVGALLTMLSKLTGTRRRGATASEVDLTVTLTEGTTLLAGEHLANVQDEPDVTFTPKANFTAPNSGSHVVRFMCTELGPVDAAINTIKTIKTAVVGWNGITASGGVELGRDVDTDELLRELRQEELQASGSATIDSIEADLLRVLEAATVIVHENTTHRADDAGRPPHSIEAIVLAPNATDSQIAQAIWNTKAAGVDTAGTSSGTAVDEQDLDHVVRFSRPAERDIWLELDVAPRDGYVGAATFKATLATRMDKLVRVGAAVTFFDVMIQTVGLGAQVVAVRLGFAVNPTASADLPISLREIARFDAGRIEVTEL